MPERAYQKGARSGKSRGLLGGAIAGSAHSIPAPDAARKRRELLSNKLKFVAIFAKPASLPHVPPASPTGWLSFACPPVRPSVSPSVGTFTCQPASEPGCQDAFLLAIYFTQNKSSFSTMPSKSDRRRLVFRYDWFRSARLVLLFVAQIIDRNEEFLCRTPPISMQTHRNKSGRTGIFDAITSIYQIRAKGKIFNAQCHEFVEFLDETFVFGTRFRTIHNRHAIFLRIRNLIAIDASSYDARNNLAF